MSILPAPVTPTPWTRIIAIGVGLAALVAIVVLAFSWPSVTAKVQNIPLSVAGPSAQIAQVQEAFDTASPGTFTFVSAGSRADAVTQIRERTSYGAIVLGDTPEVLTSSAASTITNQLLTGLAPKLQAELTRAAHAAGAPATQSLTVEITDVVPLAATDSRGSGLTAAAFPLTLGGMLGGLAASMLIVGAMRRIVAITAYVTVAGLALTGVLQGWFGVLQGDYIVNAAAIALTLLAISATIVGFASLLGRIGTLVGPIVFLLIANPISSATQPLQFLPEPWGQVGQWFPPGAGATLIRDLSYFPDTNILFPWLVLTGWSALGLTLALIGHYRQGITVDLIQDELPTPNPATQPTHPHPAHAAERHPAHVA